MARLRSNGLLDYVEVHGEEAFFAELRRMGVIALPVELCEGTMEPEEAVVYALALRGLGWEAQAQEVLEALLASAMRTGVVSRVGVAIEA